MKTLTIGFDDTDSPKGMCTTFLAYKIVGELKKENSEFLDFPNLIRFNPNIPWKTRGNGAVSIRIRTKNSSKTKNKIKNLVDIPAPGCKITHPLTAGRRPAPVEDDRKSAATPGRSPGQARRTPMKTSLKLGTAALAAAAVLANGGRSRGGRRRESRVCARRGCLRARDPGIPARSWLGLGRRQSPRPPRHRYLIST